MFILEKITTKYNETEDRFCISALTSDDSVIILWVSCRILKRLLPLIFRWLDADRSITAQNDIKSKRLMNDFAQYEAQAELKPETPVQHERSQSQEPKKQDKSWLIHEIELNYSDKVMELDIKDANNKIAKLSLSKLYARQWLMILYSQWIKSEWPMNVWPDWFTKPLVQEPTDMH